MNNDTGNTGLTSRRSFGVSTGDGGYRGADISFLKLETQGFQSPVELPIKPLDRRVSMMLENFIEGRQESKANRSPSDENYMSYLLGGVTTLALAFAARKIVSAVGNAYDPDSGAKGGSQNKTPVLDATLSLYDPALRQYCAMNEVTIDPETKIVLAGLIKSEALIQSQQGELPADKKTMFENLAGRADAMVREAVAVLPSAEKSDIARSVAKFTQQLRPEAKSNKDIKLINSQAVSEVFSGIAVNIAQSEANAKPGALLPV